MLEGVYAGIDNGYFVGEIADSAYRFEREVNSERRIVVGVNAFTEGDADSDSNLLRIDQATEDLQRKRLNEVKSRRDQSVVDSALAAITADAADSSTNLMPSIIDAVKTYATEEEIADAMRKVFGDYTERAVV